MIEYAIIAIMSIIFFWRAKDCGLVVDDHRMGSWAQEYKELLSDKKIGFSKAAWNILQGAGLFKNVGIDHVFSVFLHTINSCLVFKISGLLPAALLYLCNPINNQVTLWLNCRRYSIVIFCVLASWAFWPLSAVLYPLSAWLHVSGIMFPALFLATPFWYNTPIGALIFFLIGFKRIRQITLSRMEQYPKDSELFKITWRKAIFYVKHVGYYCQIILFPIKPRMYHEFHFNFPRYKESIEKAYRIDLDFARGAAALSFLLYEIAVNHNFWAFWFLLFISQYSGIFTATMNVADRYCSLAGIGLMVLLSQKLALLPEPYATASVWAILAFYAAIYNPLFYAYKNFETFMIYHTFIEPSGSRQRFHLAELYLKGKDQFSAFYQLKQGLKLNPRDFDMLYVMANVALLMQSPQNALIMIKRARERMPENEEDRKTSETELNRLSEMANQMLNGGMTARMK